MALAISENDIGQIAVGCFYILMRRGHVSFPGSNVARPSLVAVVNRSPGKLLRSGDAVFFPFSISWDVWQFGVVPVLEDGAYQVFHSDGTRNQVNLALIRLGDYNQYINLLVGALTAKFREIGFIPPINTSTLPVPVADLEGDGEPIDRDGVGSIGDSGFPFVDVGVDDLVYPEVEE